METSQMIRRRVRQFIARRCWNMSDVAYWIGTSFRKMARALMRLGDRAWEPKHHG
jgi:hypothetical protein